MSERRKQILVVEDAGTWQRRITRWLSSSNYDVLTADSASEAINKIETQKNIDLVLTDIVVSDKLEEQSGDQLGRQFLEFLSRTKQHDIPIAVLSSFVSTFKEELQNLGIHVFIEKESQALKDELLSRISDVFKKYDQEKSKYPEKPVRISESKKLFIAKFKPSLVLDQQRLSIPGEGDFELIKPLIGFRQDLYDQLEHFPYEKNVFLMMKFRASNETLGEFIMETLKDKGFHGARADNPAWNITGDVYNPIAVLYCCKYGIALFDEPEDHQAYNPNVAYELGIMHYQRKRCLILRHSILPDIPFNLIKYLHKPYKEDLEVRNKIESWIRSISRKSK